MVRAITPAKEPSPTHTMIKNAPNDRIDCTPNIEDHTHNVINNISAGQSVGNIARTEEADWNCQDR
jgi:hypothetical protein